MIRSEATHHMLTKGISRDALITDGTVPSAIKYYKSPIYN